jgi:hypothetical protein
VTDSVLAWTHPEMVARWERFVARCWARSWNVGITSSTRSEELQREWYRLWKEGKWPNLVADPDRDGGPSPWGWRAHGSMHQIQADGYSHALDIWWIGGATSEVHAEARLCGLRFPEPSEIWHMQFWDPWAGIYPILAPPPLTEEVDMFMVDGTGGVDEGLFLVDANTFRWVASGHEAAVLLRANVPVVHLDDHEMTDIAAARTKVGPAPPTRWNALWVPAEAPSPA